MDEKHGHTAGPKGEPSGEILGPYVLLAEIARGSLCTVHLARKHGALGFARLVALKRLSEQFAKDPECQQLLADEVRLTSGVHHANVGSVLDVGSERGRTYAVMDYVEGASLETLLMRAGPDAHPRFVVPIVVDLLHGLDALHHATSEDGRPLGIVHQAPIGRHVLVGVDGTARVIDFSQARSHITAPTRQRSERLRVHSMAPEQALEPDQVDARTDLFIVGVVLWEALTGERMFAASSEHQTFLNMLHRRVPRPSEVGFAPPPCFDSIVLRALARDPAKRYDSALAMARDLRDVALNQALYATEGELGQWVRKFAGDAREHRRKSAGEAVADESQAWAGAGSSLFPSLPQADSYGSGQIVGGWYGALPASPLRDAPDFASPALAAAEPVGYDEADPTVRSPMPERVQRLLAEEAEGVPVTPSSEFTTSFSSGNPVYHATPRSRVPTVPFSSGELTPPTPRKSMPTRPYATPFSDPTPSSDDPSESTNPAGFIPSRPGARRESNLPSPGAYSEVRERPRRSSVPHAPDSASALSSTPPGPPGFSERGSGLIDPEHVRVPHSIERRWESEPRGVAERGLDRTDGEHGVFTERVTGQRGSFHPDTGQYKSMPPKRPDSGRTSSTPPRGRPAQEPPAQKVQRSDSTPSRFNIPSSPVGSPYGVASPNQPRHYELPTPPHGFEQLQARTRELDALKLQPDSLAPTTTTVRTERPVAFVPPPKPRSMWLWAGTGTLAGIIALAAYVGLRNVGALGSMEGAKRSLAASPMLDQTDVPQANAPVPRVRPGASVGNDADLAPAADVAEEVALQAAQPAKVEGARSSDRVEAPQTAEQHERHTGIGSAQASAKTRRRIKREAQQASSVSSAASARESALKASAPAAGASEAAPAAQPVAEKASAAAPKEAENAASPFQSSHLRGPSLPENPY